MGIQRPSGTYINQLTSPGGWPDGIDEEHLTGVLGQLQTIASQHSANLDEAGTGAANLRQVWDSKGGDAAQNWHAQNVMAPGQQIKSDLSDHQSTVQQMHDALVQTKTTISSNATADNAKLEQLDKEIDALQDKIDNQDNFGNYWFLAPVVKEWDQAQKSEKQGEHKTILTEGLAKNVAEVEKGTGTFTALSNGKGDGKPKPAGKPGTQDATGTGKSEETANKGGAGSDKHYTNVVNQKQWAESRENKNIPTNDGGSRSNSVSGQAQQRIQHTQNAMGTGTGTGTGKGPGIGGFTGGGVSTGGLSGASGLGSAGGLGSAPSHLGSQFGQAPGQLGQQLGQVGQVAQAPASAASAPASAAPAATSGATTPVSASSAPTAASGATTAAGLGGSQSPAAPLAGSPVGGGSGVPLSGPSEVTSSGSGGSSAGFAPLANAPAPTPQAPVGSGPVAAALAGATTPAGLAPGTAGPGGTAVAPVAARVAEREAIIEATTRGGSTKPVAVAERFAALAVMACQHRFFGMRWVTALCSDGTILAANDIGVGFAPPQVPLDSVRLVSADADIPLADRQRWATYPMLALDQAAKFYGKTIRLVIGMPDALEGDIGVPKRVLDLADIPPIGPLLSQSHLRLVAPEKAALLAGAFSPLDLIPPAPVELVEPEDRRHDTWVTAVISADSTSVHRQRFHAESWRQCCDAHMQMAAYTAYTAADPQVQDAAVEDWLYWNTMKELAGTGVEAGAK